jgi:hypothetical protein
VPVDAPEADYPDARESIPQPYSTILSPLKITIAPEGGEVVVEIPVALLDPKRTSK